MSDATPTLQLLGCPRLLRGGAVVADLPDTLPGYLVAYLAARDQWVPRDELAALLWPQDGDAVAHNNLRVNLARLRPPLASWGIEACLVAERRRLRLDLASDVQRLRAAHARRDWARAAQEPGTVFLDGLSFRAFPRLDDWAEAERRLLQRLWREALLLAAAGAGAAQRHALAERGLAADPCDEEFLRLELDALAALGRATEVSRRFAEFAARLHSQFGSLPSAALAEHVRRHDGAVTPPAAASPGDDPLLGRNTELAWAVACLADAPLLVILGLGGIGKTRLARQLAALHGEAGGNVLWLPLAELSDVAQIVPRLLELLQMPPGGDAPALDRLVERIADGQTLLVLDNAEPLLGEREALHGLLSRLIEQCPRLRCLVTSREALQHPRERFLRLEGLHLPAPETAVPVLESAAVQLFVHHARRARPGFDAHGVSAELAQIARLTGGMPLALRIAAAWAGILSCADIAAELRRGLDALEVGGDAGVRATLAASWARLSVTQQQGLARLSVFVSPFSAQAAHEVALASLAMLAELVDRCLLGHAPMPDDTQRARFEMHPLVRAFAAERLAHEPPSQRATHERHLAWLGQALAAGSEGTPRFDHGLHAVGHHLADAVAAWRWALGHGRADFVARTTPALSNYFLRKGRAREALALFAPVEAQLDAGVPGECAALSAVTLARGNLLFAVGEAGEALVLGQRALAWARSLGQHAGTRDALLLVATCLMRQGASQDAQPHFDQALALTRTAGDRHGEAMVMFHLALLYWTRGDREQAWSLWRSAREGLRSLEDWETAAKATANLGRSLMEARRFGEALPLLEDGLRLCDEHGLVAVQAPMLANVAQLHHEAGRPEAARDFTLRSLAFARRTGSRRGQAATLLLLFEIELRDGRHGHAAAVLCEGLRLARNSGDLSNQLGALGAYGLWCLRRGRPGAAAAAWKVVLRHPQLPAQIRLWTERDWAAAGFGAGVDAERDAAALDVTVLTERALAELAEAAVVPH